MNKRKYTGIMGIIFLVGVASSFGVITLTNNRSSAQFAFENPFFKVEGDSVIRSFKVGGKEYLAAYTMFQCEENYQQNWKLESFVRWSGIIHNETSTVFTFSQLYTYDLLKEFTFSLNSSSFTVKTTKVYVIDAFSDNNQIIVDFKNNGFESSNQSAVFLNSDFSLRIDVLSAEPSIVIQKPTLSNPTEAQFNFEGKSDRDLAYHQKGQIETVTFNVTIENSFP